MNSRAWWNEMVFNEARDEDYREAVREEREACHFCVEGKVEVRDAECPYPLLAICGNCNGKGQIAKG